MFLCYEDRIIGILEIYRYHKASRSYKLEGSTECVHFEMVIIDKLVKRFQIEYHPESTILFRTKENV